MSGNFGPYLELELLLVALRVFLDVSLHESGFRNSEDVLGRKQPTDDRPHRQIAYLQG